VRILQAGLLCLVFHITTNVIAEPSNLLRNARFQDDWLTQLPESKNHNWNYPNDFFNRRDYNPDAWVLRGNWNLLDADSPVGQRRLVLQGPGATVSQTVNWDAVHDPRPPLTNFPDAGGYPREINPPSMFPERMVRDLTLRVQVKGNDVLATTGAIELSLDPPGTKLLVVSAPLPEGTYNWQWITVQLPAARWLDTVRAMAKTPDQQKALDANGPLLPGRIHVVVNYKGATGSVEVGEAQLTAAPSDAPNLLPNGGFEKSLEGWSEPTKYRYFPPGYYYIFNTWHNTSSDNRGPVEVDSLVASNGARSLKMLVPPGDEKCITSVPIALKQTAPRLIEVTARIKTDRLAYMQIDALDENGERLHAYNFINKNPNSFGTDEWREVRQIFRPLKPVQALRLQLCARGVNGFTLGGTGLQPQASAVGTIWWDDITLTEPESTPAELQARGLKAQVGQDAARSYSISNLDLGERLFGQNLLSATIVRDPKHKSKTAVSTLRWEFTSPSGKVSKFETATTGLVADGRSKTFNIPYQLTEPCVTAYTEYRGTLSLLNRQGQVEASTNLWFGTWSTPLDLEIGSMYLRPDMQQFVRLNLGLSHASLQQAAAVRLDVVRRSSGAVLKTKTIPADPATIAAQREKIPSGLREDFRALLLTDFDVSFLPEQPFKDPQRNWFLRATLLDNAGKTMASADSAPFCRLARNPPQPAVQTVAIDNDNLLTVNGQPWMPWGVTYGHNPVYDGPADPGPGKYHNLRAINAWNIYDRHGGQAADPAVSDVNSARFVAGGGITRQNHLEAIWKSNKYASTAFGVPHPPLSVEELHKLAGGKEALEAWLAYCKTAPNVVSVGPGIEEAFGNFTNWTPEQIAGLKAATDILRTGSGRPAMVGHGGYWNPLEFEKADFFDIFDPETEPLYPAAIHSDLMPLVKGQAKAIWLRPQMYENVPYERWRYHTWVEFMRGARGWQIAHGPGDVTTFRGLHGEMKWIEPAAFSKDKGPAVSVTPKIEHWSRRANGKTYIVAATTHGVTSGSWRWGDMVGDTKEFAPTAQAGRPRVTRGAGILQQDDNGYGIGGHMVYPGPTVHSIQWLPDSRSWPKGTKLVQWVRIDAAAPPKSLVLLTKANHRWIRGAAWGDFDGSAYQKDMKLAAWYMRAFYRNASGFLGWDDSTVPRTAPLFALSHTAAKGALPAAGQWIKLEATVDELQSADLQIDGIGFLHEGGRVWWGRTSLVAPDGTENVVWGDSLQPPQNDLAKTRIEVAGLKAGTKVSVAFEDREIIAGDGFFTDDFRGTDLYQRYGGSNSGYGDEPVALHVYEVPM